MSEQPGCVACSSLYDIIEQIDRPVDVNYVPQEFHESPADPGDDSRITAAVQESVSDLEAAGCDPIAICYSTAGDALGEIHAERSTIRVWAVEDCTSALLVGEEPAEPPMKATGTYYLTSGSIDHGIDPLKLYHGYLGTEHRLVDSFEQAAVSDEDTTATWYKGERYRELVANPPVRDASVVDTFFGELLGYYCRVVLLDTGTLRPFHQEYAKDVGAFFERLTAEDTPDRSVEVAVEPASDAFIRAMLGDVPKRYESLITEVPPTMPIRDAHRAMGDRFRH